MKATLDLNKELHKKLSRIKAPIVLPAGKTPGYQGACVFCREDGYHLISSCKAEGHQTLCISRSRDLTGWSAPEPLWGDKREEGQGIPGSGVFFQGNYLFCSLSKKNLRLIPKTAPLPVNPSIDQATREKKSLELYEYLYKLKDYRAEREVVVKTPGRDRKGKISAQGTAPDLAAVSAFIRAGADVNYQGEDTKNYKSCPLALAVNMEFYELADLLIANGADVNVELKENGKIGNSFSLLSRYSNDYPLSKAKYLLENGADPDYVRDSGYPLLVWAARHGQKEFVAMLLEYGADPDKTLTLPRKKNYKPGNGETALWAAANSTNADDPDLEAVASLLIRYKADVNRRAKDGTTALDRALARKRDGLVRILKAAGAKTSKESGK